MYIHTYLCISACYHWTVYQCVQGRYQSRMYPGYSEHFPLSWSDVLGPTEVKDFEMTRGKYSGECRYRVQQGMWATN